jgi:phosphate transport system substrate-binding protein
MQHRLRRTRGPVIAALALVATAVLAAGVGATTAAKNPLSGRIEADGSSTVGPYTTAAAEGFMKKHRRVRITVGISGTGGGFSRFCRGETDLSNASRPIRLNASEHGICVQNGVRYIAFTVANDGITVAVNRSNTWANCLTVDELRKIWDTGSNVDNWRDVRPSFPNVPLKLYGAGTDSGTFDFFTEKINGRSRRSRSDYQASEDDNALVRGVAGDRGALGYFGLSYFEENKSRIKAVRINNGNGCVAPSVKTVQSGAYKPLSRPLFVYANRADFRRAEVAAFIGYIFNNEGAIARKARMVALTKKQLRKARYQYRQTLRAVFRDR